MSDTQRRIRSRSVPAALALCALAGAAHAEDPVPVEFDTPVAGILPDYEAQHAYAFVAAAGQRVYVDSLVTGQNDVGWRLRDAHGRVLAENAGFFSDLGAIDLVGGEYVIEVFPDGYGSGAYAFEVSTVQDDAGPLVLGSPTNGMLEDPGSRDTYTFTASAGQRVFIDTLSSESTSGMDYVLRDAFGRVLLSSGNLGDFGPIGLVAGEHSLEVHGEGDTSGAYSFVVTDVSDKPSQPLAFGVPIAESVDGPGQTVSWTFGAAPGSALFLDVLTVDGAGQFDWHLEDAAGRVLLQTTALDDRGPLPLMGGDYVLSVLGEGSHTGGFSFEASFVPSTPTVPITIGQQVDDAIDAPGVVRTYAFDAPPGARVTLDQLATSNLLGLAWRLTDALGLDIVPRTTSLQDVAPVTLLGGGYVLEISGDGSATGSYSIRLVEGQDTRLAASLGDTLSGSVDQPGDRTTISFSAPTGTLVTFDQVASTNFLGIDWTLLDSVGRAVFGKTTSLSDVASVPLLGGDYTLVIEGETGQTGTWTIALVDLGPTPFVPAGTPIALDQPVAAQIAVAGQADAYTVDVPHGQLVFADLTASGPSTLDWSLLDPAGQVVFDAAASNVSTSDRGPFALAGGTYTLLVEDDAGGTPSYAFTLVATQDLLRVATFGDLLDDALTIPGERHLWDLVVPTDGSLFIALASGSNQLRFDLFDPAGHAVVDGLLGNQPLGPFPAAAGTWRLVVRGNGLDDLAAYVLEVVAPVDDEGPLAIGVPIATSFAGPGSTQRWLLELTETHTLTFDVLAGTNQVSWTLTDPVGLAVFGPFTPSSTSQSDQGPFPLLAGTYELLLDPVASNVPSFSFAAVESTASEFPLVPDTLVEGTLDGAGSTACYLLDVPPGGGSYYFDDTVASPGLRWTLVDEGGETLFDDDMGNVNGSDKGPLTLAAGAYALQLEVSTGSPAYGFVVHTSPQLEDVLTLDVETSGQLPAPGASLTYSFELAQTERLFFDALTGGGGLRWTLIDPAGSSAGLFANEVLSNSGSDEGPFVLPAGTWHLRLALDGVASPAWSFVVRRVETDLLPHVVLADPPVLFDGETGRLLTLTWSVENLGGETLAPGWTDRLLLSNDTQLGDADDIVLADVVIDDPVASGETYQRELTLVFPDSVGLGDYLVFVDVDATDLLDEPGGELNNAVSTLFKVVPSPATTGGCITFDQPDGASYPAGTTLALSGRALGLDASLDVIYVLDVSTSTQDVCGLDSNFDGVIDESDDLNGDNGTGDNPNPDCTEGSILDSCLGAIRIVDGLFAQNGSVTHALAPFAGTGKTADLAPEPGIQTWTTPPERDADGDGVADFEQALLSAYAIGGPFGVFGSGIELFTNVNVGGGTNFEQGFGAAATALELGPPAGERVMVFLTDGLPAPEAAYPTAGALIDAAAGGLDLRCFQLGLPDVAPSLQFMADVVDAQPDGDGTARAVSDVNDLLFELVQGLEVLAVTVNGQPVDSLDAAGRFFHLVTLQPGANVFVVEAADSAGGLCEATLTLWGVVPQDGTLDLLQDVTASLDVAYSDTTYDLAAGALTVQMRATNAGDDLLAGPLVAVVDQLSDPSLALLNPDGYTDDGRPWVTFLDTSVATVLEPGDATPKRGLRFADPDGVKVSFELQWLALGNTAPWFTSVPPLAAHPDATWTYAAHVVDAEGHAPAFALVTGPAAMTVAADTGLTTWTPGPSDVGSHDVVLRAEDGWGGAAQQSFVLVVSEDDGNHPPVFTSVPPVQSAVGAAYAYLAQAADADGDALLFEKLEGPDGVSVSSDGQLVWDFALPGVHLIALRVSDPEGASAEQAWLLAVGQLASGPGAPLVYGTPSSVGVAGQLYLYQPALDAGPLAQPEWTLPVAPAAMTVDPSSGRITWTPTLADVGAHDVSLRVTLPDGPYATQSWTVDVVAQGGNQPPTILSTPPLVAFVGDTWTYDVQAFDPDAQKIAYALATAPAGMTIDLTTGVAAWTPSTPGSELVAITATDLGGATGNQVFTLTVAPPNGAPTITSTPPAGALAGASSVYAAHAVDPDGHALTWALLEAPAGMSVGKSTGLLTWTPPVGLAGSVDVSLAVSDPFGGQDVQAFTLDVLEDTTPPSVVVALSHAPATIHEAVTVKVQATDAAPIVERMLTVDGTPVALDAAGQAVIVPEMLGAISLVGSAMDASGNLGMGSYVLPVGPDVGTPLVTLLAPEPEAQLTAPTDVVVVVDDDVPAALTWTVELERASTGDVTVIGEGNGPVDAGVVATIDPTLLPNDTYRVRVVAADGFQTGGVQFDVHVAGGNKLGAFAFDVVDVLVPLAGIPLAVTRRYSSLDTSTGDFGSGWRLGLPGDVSDAELETDSDQGLIQLLGDEPFSSSTRVYVTRPDGEREGFTFDPTPVGFPSVLGFFPAFTPDDGVTDTLEAVGPEIVSGFGGLFFDFVIPYNPDTYVLTTAEGLAYTINEEHGLQLVEDVHGNTITVTPDGLQSSLGPSIAFERDAQGRIVRVVEPIDPADPDHVVDLHYGYDPATGDLVSFVDQLGNETSYAYGDRAHPHRLTELTDPLGTPLLKTVYDEQGQLLALCGADGDVDTLDGCTLFTTDSAAGLQTVIDARGVRTDRVFDAAGDLVLERTWRFDLLSYVETAFTWDAAGHMTSVTDPLGNVTTMSYDAAGNLVARTDPAGRTTTWAYVDGCSEPVAICDPTGACTTIQRDGDCAAVMFVDALGGVTQIVRDDDGRITDVIDPVGSAWHYEYDALGYPASISAPGDGGSPSIFEHDVKGQLQRAVDSEGRERIFTWDDKHRLVGESWDDGTEIAYEYDANGNLLRSSSPDAVITWDYWPVGLPRTMDTTATPGAPGVVVSYGVPSGGGLQPGYDGDLNITHVSDSLGGLTAYAWDEFDRLVSVAQSTPASALGQRPALGASPLGLGQGTSGAPTPPGPSLAGGLTPERLVTLAYDDAGLMREVVRGTSLAGTQPVVRSTYGYDCGGCPKRVALVEHIRASDDAVLDSLAITRDDAGRPTSLLDAQGLHSYAHDGTGRLLSADHPGGSPLPDESYTYDAAGNRLASHLSATTSYAYQSGSGGSQLLSDDDHAYTYDRNGSLVRAEDLSTGEVTTYAYDHRNRLVSAVVTDAALVELHRAEYAYDATDRRVRSVEDGVVRHVVYDGDNPLLVLDDAGALVARRTYGRGIDQAFGEEIGGQTRWLLPDHRNSMRVVTDAAGQVVAQRTYDSFGRRVASSGVSLDTDLGFQGRPGAGFAELLDFRARGYTPGLGRFLSKDPVAPHAYAFVSNSPLTLLDPSGRTELIEYACFAVSAVKDAYQVSQAPAGIIEFMSEEVVKGLNGEGGGGDVDQAVNDVLEAILEILTGEINPFPEDPIDAFCEIAG